LITGTLNQEFLAQVKYLKCLAGNKVLPRTTERLPVIRIYKRFGKLGRMQNILTGESILWAFSWGRSRLVIHW